MTFWDLVTLFTKEWETKKFYQNPDEAPDVSIVVFSFKIGVSNEYQIAFDVRISV